MSGVYCEADIKARCVVDASTGCWSWRGAFSRGKAGSLTPATYLPDLDRVVTVQRAMVYLRTGALPSPGHRSWSTCETRHCCNHVGSGTPAEHGAWLRRTGALKGRLGYILAASKCPQKRHLKPETVAEIRSSDELGVVLAARLGVSRSIVSRVRRGETYRGMAASSVFAWRAAA